MLILTHIPPRAHTYLDNLSLMLGRLMPVAFLTPLPGTFSLWTAEKRWTRICSKAAKILQHRLNQTSALMLHIASAFADKSMDSGMATHLISCQAPNATTWLFHLSPPSAHHFLINMLSVAHKVRGGAAFQFRGHVEICPLWLTSDWDGWLNQTFSSNTPWWDEGAALFFSSGTEEFSSSAEGSSAVILVCGITREEWKREVRSRQRRVNKPLKSTCLVNGKSHIYMDFPGKLLETLLPD